MMAKKMLFLLVIATLSLSIFSGCATRRQSGNEPTEFMAWHYAGAVVLDRIPQPGKANFPRFNRRFIERTDDNVFTVRAYVNTLGTDGNALTFNFTVTARYQGNDVFETLAAEVVRAP